MQIMMKREREGEREGRENTRMCLIHIWKEIVHKGWWLPFDAYNAISLTARGNIEYRNQKNVAIFFITLTIA